MDPFDAYLAESAGRRVAALNQGLALVRSFFEVARVLSGEGIGFAPLKGISLLISGVYPDEASRATSDVDLFIAAEDFPRVRTALMRAGCLPKDPPLAGGVMKNHGQEATFVSSDGAEIDVHYRLFPWYLEAYVYKINSRAFFDAARSAQWRGLAMRFLRPEDEFFYALLSWLEEPSAFRYALDADALVRARSADFDWRRAAAHLSGGPARYRLAAAARFLAARIKTPFPAEFLSALPVSAAAAPSPGEKFRGGAGAALAVLFVKWQLFKRLGWFRAYFVARNNPGGVPA